MKAEFSYNKKNGDLIIKIPADLIDIPNRFLSKEDKEWNRRIKDLKNRIEKLEKKEVQL